MKEEEEYELEDFLFERLSVEKKAAFAKRLKSEPELTIRLEELRRVKEAAERFDLRQRIKDIQAERLKEWEQDHTESEPKNGEVRLLWPKLLGAAAAACLVFALYLGQASFQLPDTLSLKMRGEADGTSKVEEVVFQQYLAAQEALGKGQFEAAAKGFDLVKRNGDIRPYYRDASIWFEIVATSEFDEGRSAALWHEIQGQKEFSYPVSWIEKWKLKLRLWF